MLKERGNFYYFTVSIIILLTVSICLPSVSLADEKVDNVTINEGYEKGKSLQPVAPAFDVESLLKWSPEDDPDSELNQSSIPLNDERFKGHQVNPLANPEVGITSAAITLADHDLSSSVGSNDFNVYAFDNWQLMESYIYWPGAPNKEGVFALPSPDIVDAAHLNGVPVYASIGFPWGPGSPETLEEIDAFTKQTESGSFPVADKMIEVAEYYGFDGYFFNQETSGVSKETAERMNDMMRYLKSNSNMNISWYDSQSNDGTISYQNAVNDKNDMYVKRDEDGAYAVDEFFLNYNWGVSEIDTTVSTLQKYDHSPYNAYAGFELQQNSHNTKVNTNALLDENDQSKVSIALYTPDSTMGLADNPADFHNEENHLWTGPQGDPTAADDSEDWKGMARFATDSSVIQSKPFTTNFNSGHGKNYFADGKEVSNQEWNNRSVQDIMPTWRWWTRGEDSDLQPKYDFEKAFNGGNSLNFNGDLKSSSEHEVMLYSTKLDIGNFTKVSVTYQNEPGADVSLGIALNEDYSEEDMIYYTLPDSGKGWQTEEIDLGQESGETAYALSLNVENTDEIEDYDFNLGKISVYDDKGTTLPSVENTKIKEKILKSSYEAEARLEWDEVKDALHYEVYQENGQGDVEFLGVTPNNHFYTPNISRTEANMSKDNITEIKIVPVNNNYNRGKETKVKFDWGMNFNATETDKESVSPNAALNATISDVSFENPAEPASKALDGSSSTKWAATNKQEGYLNIDIGEEKTTRRWRVEHAESGGEEKNMNTLDFELLYKDKSGDWQSADRVIDNHDAITDIVLKEPVTASEFKLQVHNSGASPWAAIRIYEWQLFESDKLPKTENILMHFATAENNKGANDKVTLENVGKNQVVRLYGNLKSTTPIAEKTSKEDGSVTIDNLDLAEDANRIYYTVQTPDVDESLKYSIGYLSEHMDVKDIELDINIFDLKNEFADHEIVHGLKFHIRAVEHYVEYGKYKKAIKHLNGFQNLIEYQKEKHLISDTAATSLKATTKEVIKNLE